MAIVRTETERVDLAEARLRRQRYLPVKRAGDILLCLALLPVALPLITVLALLIVVDSPGWPFFVQERIGKDGCAFRLFKFRTMAHNYDDTADRAFMQAFVAGQAGNGSLEQDAINKPIRRKDITRVGRILRKASLDELPQIVNVLKGEMSLIGPRPNVPWEVEAYKPWHRERLEVLPGITGLAQVHGRSSISFDEIAAYDIEYVRNMGLRADLRILWHTATSVLTGDGAL